MATLLKVIFSVLFLNYCLGLKTWWELGKKPSRFGRKVDITISIIFHIIATVLAIKIGLLI